MPMDDNKLRNVGLRTVIGAHMWGRPEGAGDFDEFNIYVEDVYDVLRGAASQRSYHDAQYEMRDDGLWRDVHLHAAGKVVDQLCKSNPNMLMGIVSPEVLIMDEDFRELRDILLDNLHTGYYSGLHGWIFGNIEKYKKRPMEDQRVKAPKLMELLMFGCKLMRGKVEFVPAQPCTLKDVERQMGTFERAYKNSQLPDSPPEDRLRDWLLETRLKRLP